ncbi:fasciclin-3 isoform X1 [Halyomorpha halys]|uniref:fasciclin-3 isoform X1 n=1 Tax=Halyomorpha halys TaxID=286706 RepID=UPI0006D50D95
MFAMNRSVFILFFSISVFSYQVLSAAGDVVSVTPKEQTVREGDPIQMLCKLPQPLEFCRISYSPSVSIILTPDKKTDHLSYFGEGFEKGHCGVMIYSAKDSHNGNVTCSLTAVGSLAEKSGTMKLTVAKRPSKPELMIARPENPDGNFNENEIINAFCIVKNGRPAANITWYIGDEKLTDGLSTILVEQYEPQDLHTVSQNLTRRVQASDNGKQLKCIAGHPLLNDNSNTTSQIISVKFAPKDQSQPLERFGLVEGEEGKITVTVMANPKPDFMWVIGEDRIYEGDQDASGRFKVLRGTPSENNTPGSWDSVLLIDQLMKEDVERNYQLVAKNTLGEKSYSVSISTSPEPRMFELGAPAIVGIVVAVLVILTAAALLVFARAKGRWCFAGATAHFAGESSDTESADHHHHASNPKIKKTPFTSVFKKKAKEPVAEPNQEEQQEAAEEDREEDSKDEAGRVMLNPDEGVVYAELDLTVATPRVQVKPEEEKTEYAEIIHSKGK